MRRYLGLSVLSLILITGLVGCDSYAGRKPDSEATKLTPATAKTATTNFK